MTEPAGLAAAVAALVDAIGRDALPDRMLELLRLLAGTDLCSAFLAEPEGRLGYLFAAGRHPAIPGFAEIASLDYARRYWQRDRMTRQMLGAGAARGGPILVRQSSSTISDPEYRRACYERAGIVERLTLYGAGTPTVLVSAYRLRDSGPSSALGTALLEAQAPVIVAAARRHAELRMVADPPPIRPPHEAVVERLAGAGGGLSAREVETAAGLLVGSSQRDIAARIGVALSSVVTYRQRAYRKLGVTSRRELVRFYEELATRMCRDGSGRERFEGS